MITLVDYGVGNIRAFQNVYKRLNIPVRTAKTADDLRDAERIILPGVGAFDQAMALLDASEMRPVLDDLVLNRRVPVLGVCVGMQMLANGSEEGVRPGLGWIPGMVRRFRSSADAPALPLPHMGWNEPEILPDQPLFRHLEADSRFYFLHSYYFECAQAQHAAARVEYGGSFSCAVSANNIHGVQFHPEKSHRWGMRLLQNFAEL